MQIQRIPMPNELDYTMLSTYQQCHRKYYLRIGLGLVGLKPPIPLLFGSAIHMALDTWYTDRNSVAALDMFNANFEDDPSDPKRTVAVGSKILAEYFVRYANDRWKILSSELIFELPLPGQGGRTYMGRIDKVLDWDDTILIADHKTTSRLGHTFFYKLTPNAQFDGYVWAARQLGFPVAGAVLDAISTAKTAPEKLGRDIAMRSDAQIDEWLGDVGHIIGEMEHSHETCYWTRATDRCCDYVECPYRKICLEEPSFRQTIIDQDYRVEHWDPRGHGGTDGKVRSQCTEPVSSVQTEPETTRGDKEPVS